MKKTEDIPCPKPLPKLPTTTVQEILSRLQKGNQYFVKNLSNSEKLTKEEQKRQTKGQKPYAIILGCADSRVAPELVFNTSMGELFTVRVAGNIASPAAIASIEYAVAVLGTKVIIVLGHQSCGAVGAAIANKSISYNIDQLLAYIKPAMAILPTPDKDSTQAVKDTYKTEVIKKNAILTVGTLAAQSTIIRDAVKSGAVTILPAYYHLTNGKVDFLA